MVCPKTVAVRAAITLLLAGAGLITYSWTWAPYTDSAAFEERAMSLSAGQSREYHELRDTMLTPKYGCEDAGGTCLMVGMLILLGTRCGGRWRRTPADRSGLVAIAVAAPVLTVVAYGFGVIQGVRREEHPWFADSVMIPMMGLVFVLAVLLGWAFLHVAVFAGRFRAGVPIIGAFSRRANWWLLFVAAVTAILGVDAVISGEYWTLVPCAMWEYFFLAMAASRVAPAG